MLAVTVTTLARLPRARVMAESYARHHDGADVAIIVVDPLESGSEAGTVAAASIFANADDFRRLAFCETAQDLCSGVKPFALAWALDSGAHTALYLDDDAVVYAPLADLEAAAGRAGLALVPRRRSVNPADGLRPDGIDLADAGPFETGLIAVSGTARPALAWWQERVTAYEYSTAGDAERAALALATQYFGHTVVDDPGLALAYWNADERALEHSAAGITAGGAPLRMARFAGFDPDTPWVLSTDVADRARVLLSEYPVLRGLADDYATTVLTSRTGADTPVAYRWDSLADGTRVTGPMRRLYRDATRLAVQGVGALPPVPFSGTADDGVREWFLGPETATLNRLAAAVWRSRPDLQTAFPGAAVKASGLHTWLESYGVSEGAIPAGWAKISARQRPAFADSGEVAGVNVCGYFTAELGMGQLARLVLEAARASGLPVAAIPTERTESRKDIAFTATDDGMRYPVNLVAVNADQFPLWVRDMGGEFLARRHTVGIWAWEVAEFPASQRAAFDSVDEVWAISTFARDAIARETNKPVFHLPIPIPVPSVEAVAELDRGRLGLRDAPYFLFAFDYFSVFERKNPLGLVEAFARAFPDASGPTLVIKGMNGGRRRADRERLRRACENRSDIVLIDDYLEPDELRALMANAAAYVSLHRSEGYGLTIAEAMALGTPVIATAYSGNMDFMTDGTAFAVPFTLVPVPKGSGPYPATASWAEPDLDAAAECMRRVLAEPARAREVALAAQEAVRRTGDVSIAAEFVKKRVEEIMEEREREEERKQHAAHVAASTALPDAPGLEKAREAIAGARAAIRTPLSVDEPSRAPFIARPVRRVIRKALAHQERGTARKLDAVVDAVDAATVAAFKRIDEIQLQLDAQDRPER